MAATTTCSYGQPTLVYRDGAGAFYFAQITQDGGPLGSFGGLTFSAANATGLTLEFATSTCVTIEDGGGGGGTGLSTDPVLVVLVAAFLVIYTADYVRRLFYS